MIWRWYLAALFLPIADGVLTMFLAFGYGGIVEFSWPVTTIRGGFFLAWLVMAALLFSPIQAWLSGRGDAAAARRRLQILRPAATWIFIIDYGLYQLSLVYVLPQFEIHIFGTSWIDISMVVGGRMIFMGYLVHVLADSYVTHMRSHYFRQFHLEDGEHSARGALVRRILLILGVTAFFPLIYMIMNILVAPADQVLRRGVAIAATGLVAVFIATVVGGSRVYYPLNRLMEGLWAVRSGRIDVRVPVTTNDEIGLLTSAFNEMLLRIRRQEFLRSHLGPYLQEDSFQQLLQQTAPLAPVTADGSLMLVDVDNFRAGTLTLAQRDRAKLLNAWRQKVIEVARKYDGVPVSFMADRMLVCFGLPVQTDDWKEQAFAAALELQALSLQQGVGIAEDKPLKARIRLHSGRMTGGIVGARDSLSYEVLGTVADNVRRLDMHPVGRKESLVVTEAALPMDIGKASLRRLGIVAMGNAGAQQPVFAVSGLVSEI